MTKFHHVLMTALLIFMLGAACVPTATALPTPAPTATTVPPKDTAAPLPSVTPIPPPTQRPTITLEPTNTPFTITLTPVFDPNGQKVTFQTFDGVELVGYYYLGYQPKAPVVILMHQFGSNQNNAWAQSDLIPWLRNKPVPQGQTAPLWAAGMLPPMTAGVSFNVLTFDFRGHGESGGITVPYVTAESQKGYLLDAEAAYAFARGLPNADPHKIIGFGTSIGADAAVDTCDKGCVGAFSISPGSWLGPDWYTMALRATKAGKQVRCMSSFNDGITAGTCASLPNSDFYRYYGYEGKKHGEDFLVPRKMEIEFGSNLLSFLMKAIGK